MTNKVDNKPCQELNKKFDPIDWILGHDVDTVIDNYKHQFSKMARNKYTELLEELQMLQKENKTLNKTIDMQHETTISDLKLIGKLQQENKDWAESAEISNGRIRQLRKFNDVLDKENDNLKNIITEMQMNNKVR